MADIPEPLTPEEGWGFYAEKDIPDGWVCRCTPSASSWIMDEGSRSDENVILEARPPIYDDSLPEPDEIQELIVKLGEELLFRDDLLYSAWVVIANAWEGDWSKAPVEWQEAARRWRDRWHAEMQPIAEKAMFEPLSYELATTEVLAIRFAPDGSNRHNCCVFLDQLCDDEGDSIFFSDAANGVKLDFYPGDWIIKTFTRDGVNFVVSRMSDDDFKACYNEYA